ncbi:Ulp1 family isopeptidase [Bradyrhizobium sp. WSM3983]|uniref:Ulp1 family isopeptidase n=1 Tax=Bradyrhizobium sp. WSM3983 TaxID=1038867 RepID=UPI0004067669|nr:Ulp1 family isopeptidase [Bradyrhizobium sp. WSM3983]
MEPNYSDPNYYMRWYAEQQELQRAQQESNLEPADQASFELQSLRLRSPEVSSPEVSSPDTPAARSHENIQRTDIGGSTRMPPTPDLWDNSFSSTRYSVDVPHAHLGSAANDYRSDLRDRPFGSMRYATPSEAQSTARSKHNKSRGLFSRVKSGLSQVFGGRREKWSSDPASDDLYSELRIDFAKRGRPSEADMQLIEEFKAALGSANRKTKTIENYVTALRMFSEFLQSKGTTLKALLGNTDLLTAYKADFMKGASANSRNYVGGALDTLRNFHAGRSISAPDWVNTQDQAMHPSDERMLGQFVKNVKDYRIEPDGTRGRGTGQVPLATIKSNVQALNAFARWLRAQNRRPLAPRAFNEPRLLAADIDEYVNAGGDDGDRLSAALSHLRRIGADGLQSVGAGARLMGRETLSAHPEDIADIDDFLTAALSKLGSDATSKEKAAVSAMVSRLRSFSDWLQREDRPSIMERIGGNAEQQSSLNADYAAFSKATKRTAALDSLREYLGLAPQRALRPYDDDANLIQGLVNEELRSQVSEQTKKSVRNLSSALRKFSDWLRTEGKESIASRVNGDSQQQRSLEADRRAFTDAKGRATLNLKKLRQYVQVIEANRAMGVNIPEQTADLSSTPTWMRDLPTPPSESEWPPVLDPFGQAGLQGPAGSSSTWSPQLPSYFDFPTLEGEPARSSDIYRGLSSFTDLPPTPQELRDDAQSRPVLSPAGRPPFFIGPSGVPQDLEDIGHLVGDDWQHGTQPVSDFLLDVLDNRTLLPNSQFTPQPVAIHGETYSITLGPRGRRDAQLIHHPGPSSVPDARIVASTASASAGHRDRSGRVLGARQWLGDEHIQRDYGLLSQELQQSNPNLAARTRFVDPLIAGMIREGTDDRALREYQRIVYDRNDNDVADFLFFPMNDSNAEEQERYLLSLQRRDAGARDRGGIGSHWSLLLVDRRNRDRPIAYHYDSAQGHNAGPAARLAARIGADLQDAPMSQQRNGYDCGVFVVDGTRALVRRLAGRRHADLSLGGLVIDRQALQNRLSG